MRTYKRGNLQDALDYGTCECFLAEPSPSQIKLFRFR